MDDVTVGGTCSMDIPMPPGEAKAAGLGGVENAILQSALQPAGMISGFPLDIRRRASGALLALPQVGARGC